MDSEGLSVYYESHLQAQDLSFASCVLNSEETLCDLVSSRQNMSKGKTKIEIVTHSILKQSKNRKTEKVGERLKC